MTNKKKNIVGRAKLCEWIIFVLDEEFYNMNEWYISNPQAYLATDFAIMRMNSTSKKI